MKTKKGSPGGRVPAILLSLLLSVFCAAAPSCSSDKGDSVGDGTVDIEYATEPPAPSPDELIASAKAMEPVLKALIASAYAVGGYRPTDPDFVGMTLAAAGLYSDTAVPDAEIMSAAFGGETPAAPSDAAAPEFSYGIEITDMIDNDDGYIAYINVIGGDGTVRDIFTANMTASPGGRYAFSVTSLLRMTIGTSSNEDT
ncbi:MAG: hypothetical protein K6D94_05285 [Clostridiales bacterium]|nr:hypothetical protein [Clostridiales bacterium]